MDVTTRDGLAAQERYARWLAWGMKLSLALLALGFAAYASGLVAPHIPIERLPELWTRPSAELLEQAAVRPGWAWAALIHRSDMLVLAGTALLASCSIPCLVAVIAVFRTNRERILAVICTLQVAVLVLAASGVLTAARAATDAEFDVRRRAMVEEIAAYQPGLPFDRRVMEAVARVPRHLFVPPAQQPHAYENRPLPIGHQQTISQPYIVALMTHLIKPSKQDRVLEVGTGSGYQAAVLAELVRSVYTIEIVEPLAIEARQRLARLGYRNVEVRTGDGYKGWEEHAPFDAIMVTAGASEVPPPLLRQLKPGGRMVIPVGPTESIQYLTLIEKQADGSIRSRQIAPVRFVPLTRER